MIRMIDKVGRVHISHRWMEICTDATVVIIINKDGLILQPYDPQKHNLEQLLCRRLDDRARIKIPPDILRALGFLTEEQYHLYIGPDDTALLRRMGDYCDVCGLETQTEVILGRNICTGCLDLLKKS